MLTKSFRSRTTSLEACESVYTLASVRSSRPKTRVLIRLAATMMPTTATRKKAAFEAAERFFLSMLMVNLLPLPGFEGGGRDEQRQRDDRHVVDEVARIDDPAAHVLEVRIRAD